MERYRHWLALKRIERVGNTLYRRLLEAFETPEGVFAADREGLQRVQGISQETIEEILSFRGFDEIDSEFEKIEKGGASLLSLHDPDYPPLLAAIHDPPPLLYFKGEWGQSDPYPIAVVGARKTTPYGQRAAEQLCGELAYQGLTVVSGFARGIDGFAHRSALAAGGRTIGVLGCGIDRVYPPEHRALYGEIVERGVLFSEFPMEAFPEAHHFPQRNRIISGLSLGCLVVEAAAESGSLITARLALEQGREVFAVPGPIFSETSAGPHRLIASGAKLVQTVDDILEELLPQLRKRGPAPAGPAPALEGEEERLYRLLSLEPKHIDQVIQESAKTASMVSALLLMLELKGAVRQLAGQFYVRI